MNLLILILTLQHTCKMNNRRTISVSRAGRGIKSRRTTLRLPHEIYPHLYSLIKNMLIEKNNLTIKDIIYCHYAENIARARK